MGLAPKLTPIPGTNYSQRIDNPTQPNQQKHVHIYDAKGNEINVINEDGSGSHGNCPEDLPKDKKMRNFLRSKGFQIGAAETGVLGAVIEVGAAGYTGWQIGSAINDAIIDAYGQNAGTALYDLIHE